MNKKLKKIALITSVVCVSAALSACGGGDSVKAPESSNKVTYWCSLDSSTSQTVSNMGETPLAKALMEKFGCTIEYQHPAHGQGTEKFNVMIASNNLPDIIQYTWGTNYPGGFSGALSDGVIQEINLEKDAPNLAACIGEHPELEKRFKTDEGKYYGYPFVRYDDFLATAAGPIVRQDWLEELGMDLPETIDDWTEMLQAFKEKKGARVPLTIYPSAWKTTGLFVGAYGVFDGLYVQGNEVKYGPLEDGYKDFLIKMNEWFAAGLLDPDYASIDTTFIQSNILNGAAGATYGYCGSGLGKWMAGALDDKFNLTGVKYPVLHRGDTPQFGDYDVIDYVAAAISRDCKNRELCTRILDYGYSEEGRMLFNFGVESESYEMIDGYPTYTELITNNPDGLSMAVSLARYAITTSGPFVQDKRYMEQYAKLPQQKEALTRWMNTDMKNHALPTVSFTAEQQSEIATVKENIDTYKTEMQAKFIMGIEPIDNFDNFRENLKARGVEKYIQYEQEAYERYMSR